MNKIERAIYDVKLHIADKKEEIEQLITQRYELEAKFETLEEMLETLEAIEKDDSIPH